MTKLTKNYFNHVDGTEEVRINKFLSDTGMCSRREADALVAAGRVLIDGEPARMGSRVLPGQKVTVEGKEAVKEERMVLIVFNKPQGVVCTSDRREPDNIVDFINYGTRIFPIGRLDKDSEGLILLTNNGEIVNKILRAGNEHEKEYIVSVNKPITEEFLRGMAGGVPILDTVTKPCRIEQLDNKTFKIILTQGLNRQIRRMCEYFGYRVCLLNRVRVMNISLGRLKPGTYRNLTENELSELNRLIGESTNASAAEEGMGERNMPSEGIAIVKKREGKYREKSGGWDRKKDEETRFGSRREGGRNGYQNAGSKTGRENLKERYYKGDFRPGNREKSGTNNKDGAVWKKKRNESAN